MSEKCPVCHKYWEESFHGLYCPECGQTPEDVRRRELRDRKTRKPARHVETKEERSARIRAENERHPIYGYAYRLTAWLAEFYGVEVKTVMRNIQAADCRKKSDGFLIRYGYERLDDIFNRGYNSRYKISEHLLGRDAGKAAIWAQVVHEFAHVIQYVDNGGWFKRDHHKASWVNAIRKIQRDFDFADVANL